MHTLTERELSLDLTNEEVVELALQISERFNQARKFKQISVEVEEVPYVCVTGSSGPSSNGPYTLLKVICESTETNQLLGGEFTNDSIIVDRKSESEGDVLSLIDNGKIIADMLRQSAPTLQVEECYPKIVTATEVSNPDPKPEVTVVYSLNGEFYSASAPNEEIANKIKDTLKQVGCNICE